MSLIGVPLACLLVADAAAGGALQTLPPFFACLFAAAAGPSTFAMLPSAASAHGGTEQEGAEPAASSRERSHAGRRLAAARQRQQVGHPGDHLPHALQELWPEGPLGARVPPRRDWSDGLLFGRTGQCSSGACRLQRSARGSICYRFGGRAAKCTRESHCCCRYCLYERLCRSADSIRYTQKIGSCM